MINPKEKIIIREERENYENSLLDEYEKLENEKNGYFLTDDQYNDISTRLNEIENEFAILDSFNKNVFFEMANFQRSDSGLSCNFWIDEEGKDRKKKDYQPRVKVEDPNHPRNFISISISKEPKILAGKFDKTTNINDIYDFIKKSYNDLMAVWNKQMTSLQFMIKYKK